MISSTMKKHKSRDASLKAIYTYQLEIRKDKNSEEESLTCNQILQDLKKTPFKKESTKNGDINELTPLPLNFRPGHYDVLK